MKLRTLLTTICCWVVSLSGCETLAVPSSAVLASNDHAALKEALAEAMNIGTVTLGPDNPSQVSTFSILPPPPSTYEGRSLAVPIVVRLIVKGSDCYAVRQDTKEEFYLKNIRCLARQ